MLIRAKIATIALLSLIGSGCCTTAHLDINVPEKPKLPTLTAEQENSIDSEVWKILQEREAIIKEYANRLIRSIREHNKVNE